MRKLRNIRILFELLYLFLQTGLLKELIYLTFRKSNISASSKKNIGVALCNILERMGPAFVKFGQVLSTRSDLLGETISGELFALQDRVQPFSFTKVQKILETEFGTKIESKFLDFEQQSIAAGSVAQVHKATTKDGQHVAVKILRPDIEKIFTNNIDSIRSLINILNFCLKKNTQLRLDEVFKTIEKNLDTELNMLLEAAAAVKMKKQCDYKHLYIPKVYWELTTKKVLTIEWIEGTPLKNKKQFSARNIDRKLIATNLSAAFIIQVCHKGFFHADIHPGNIMILNNNKLALLDFGIICHLDIELKHFIAEVVHAFLTKNYKKVCEIHFNNNLIKDSTKKHEFELACTSIGEMIVGKDSNDIHLSKLMRYLLEIGRKFSMQIKPELLLLHKTILTMEGVGRFIDPEINMWELTSPWIKKWIRSSTRKIEQLELIKLKQKNLLQNVSEIVLHKAKEVQNENKKKSPATQSKILINLLIFTNISLFASIVLFVVYYITKFG